MDALDAREKYLTDGANTKTKLELLEQIETSTNAWTKLHQADLDKCLAIKGNQGNMIKADIQSQEMVLFTEQIDFFNKNNSELQKTLVKQVFIQEMKWFKEREGKSFDEKLLPGYINAAKYVYDRNSYKIMRKLNEGCLE